MISIAYFQDEMALTNADKKWIQEQHYQAHDSHGWHRVARWLKDWGVLSGVITGSLALFGIAITCVVFAVSEVRNNAEFRGNTASRLVNIEAQLRTIQASQSPKKILQEIAQLDQKTFTKNLPALRKITEQPLGEVGSTSPLLREVSRKLAGTSENTPYYWPTVFRFIEFATSNKEGVPPAGSPVNFTIADVSGLGEFKNQVIVFNHGRVSNTRFQKCRIIFRNSDVIIKNVIFVDCVFEFPNIESPAPFLQYVAKKILGSKDFEHVALTT